MLSDLSSNQLILINHACSGIYIEHNDFSGRAKYGYDVFNPENPQTDGHGHGTHVAGN